MRARVRSLLSVAAFAAPLPAVAAPPCPACPTCPEVAPAPRPAALATKAFPVMDLVCPIPYGPTPPAVVAWPVPHDGVLHSHPLPVGTPRVAPPTPLGPVVQTAFVAPLPSPVVPSPVTDLGTQRRENAAKLVRLVKSVCPHQWKELGGSASADYFDNGGALVVNASPAVLAEVADLLTALRKLQDVCIAVETRVLTVPAGFGAEHLFAEVADGQPVFLADEQVAKVLAAAQGASVHTQVVQPPKVTLFSGQTANLVCGDTVFFTTAVDEKQVNGQTVMVPRNEAVQLGLNARLTATASADQKFVKLGVRLEQARVDGPVPLFPITSLVTPVFEGGAQGKPVPFTQFIQQPKIERNTVETTVSVPDGGTVVMGGLKTLVEVRSEFGPPVLSRVPYVNRLFKNVGIRKEPMETVVLVTARVIVQDEAAGGPAGELVAAYKKALAAGKPDEAVRLAIQALAADPGCFATPGK